MKKLILSVAAAICSFAAFAGAAKIGMTYVDTKTSIVWKFNGSREYAEPGLWTAAIEGAEMMDGSAVSGVLVIPEKLGEYTVTKINKGAFTNNTGITGVTLPTDGEVSVKAFMHNGAWVTHGLYGGAAALAAGKIDEVLGPADLAALEAAWGELIRK